ncbi:MAG TPA: RecX family transcriptional regulator [Solirubrobacteraceae bacterium]|jgi:regulatory protein
MSSESPPAVEHALGLAYAHLNRRDRTVAELRIYLGKRGIHDDVAEVALDELCDQGYLDDDRFARLFAQDKSHLEQWGNDRIRRALIGRGIPEHVADAAVGGGSESGELERALALLERRFPAGCSGRPESQRALGVLLRKGYDYELASDALSEHRRRVGQAA